MRKNQRWRLKQDKNECECILMWWSTNKIEIDLSHIWVKSEQDVWKVKRDETHFNMMMHSWIETHLSHIWIKFKWDVWVKFKQDLSQIWAKEKRNAI